MKITLVGPGIMSIPPKGWGAVEILIYDYKIWLEKKGHIVTIVNTRDPRMIVYQINQSNPDFVHFHFDQHYYLFNYVKCPHVAVTSHFCYLEQKSKYYGFNVIFEAIVNQRKVHVFSLAPGISEQFINAGFPAEKTHLTPNGVRPELFRFADRPAIDKSIFLAKIDGRKRQFLFQDIAEIDFAGGIADHRFNPVSKNYLGEWSKGQLYENLTNYGNLILLSDGEAHPLVCMEAMSAGLGLVISEYAAANLKIDLPFIEVIPENRILDKTFVKQAIAKNRNISIKMRPEIRKYVTENFSMENIIDNYYIPAIEQLILMK